MKITGILLAAGTSSRMGRNKLLMKYKNHTVVEETLLQLLNSKVDDVILVTGFESSRMQEQISKNLTKRIRIVYNAKYDLGRAESIKCAVKEIDDKADAVLFMVADKPGVTSQLIDRAIDRFKEGKPAILYVKTPSGRGHPIIFSKELFSDLLLLNGDRIGDDLIGRCKDDVVELEDGAVQVDVDTKRDYRMLTKKDMCSKEVKEHEN